MDTKPLERPFFQDYGMSRAKKILRLENKKKAQKQKHMIAFVEKASKYK